MLKFKFVSIDTNIYTYIYIALFTDAIQLHTECDINDLETTIDLINREIKSIENF